MARGDSVLVVGAGVSGLSVAAGLAPSHVVTVIDRLPVPGGTRAGYEHTLVESLKRRCDDLGVRFLLGTTALRWNSDLQLLVASPVAGFTWLRGSHLAFAGGVRPSTPAELRLLGERLGGVLQGSVAYHLLDSGIRLGSRIAVIGAGDLARRLCRLLAKQGSRICVVDPDGDCERSDFAEEWWPGWSPVELAGSGRVQALFVARGEIRQRIHCDGVILAARMRPLRNVDGAIYGSPSVTFVQPAGATMTPQQVAAHAVALLPALLDRLGRDGQPAAEHHQ